MATSPPKPTAKSRIREAEPKDINAITTAMITSLSSDAMWRYRFAHRDKYPEDLLKYARLYIELLVSGSFPDYATLIVEVEEDSVWNTAAFSIWDISYENKRVYTAKGETYTSQSRTSLSRFSPRNY
ncbi:predicted protein [Sclerotinia sclerotiorum 1980 UF-70]|uniref:N-acetyltransferase domain-containing protein n=1 Tax=Sclerotinia sclerotiorum (strain ATCC 18683 / 1980 / Ss-1) TaxID=665079 RepID=A7EEA4_SCLS1|nr:predicted protein [Sclerotinia sclerotiorum 1980 UF-70]EDO01170.1 predicted protein [Sclerotinia sclerotiorum 1980 UF-70]